MNAPPANLPKERFFAMYSGDTPEPEIRAAFRARYGAPPAHIFANCGALWAGPLPQEQAPLRWQPTHAN